MSNLVNNLTLLIYLAIAIWAIKLTLAFWGSIVFVAVHFIRKYW